MLYMPETIVAKEIPMAIHMKPNMPKPPTAIMKVNHKKASNEKPNRSKKLHIPSLSVGFLIACVWSFCFYMWGGYLC